MEDDMLEPLSLLQRSNGSHVPNSQGILNRESRVTSHFTLLRPTIMAGAILLGVFAGTTISAAFAQDVPNLFSESVLPSDSDVSEAQADSVFRSMAQEQRDPTVLRSRHVKARMSALAEETQVGLNLFNDEYLVFEKDQMKKNDDNNYVIHGKAMGKDNSDALFTLEDDVMVGNIRVDGKTYQIRYAGNGIQTIREVDESKVPDSMHPIQDNTGTEKENRMTMEKAASDGGVAADAGDVIDVMVVYTPAAATAAGGTNAIKAEIRLAVEEANQAYANSRVTQRLRLVHTAQVSYTEGNMFTDLDRLKNKTDGYMDVVHSWRNTYAADLVNLWTTTGSGVGYLLSNESRGFSLNNRTLATSNFTFAHELGHNMGAHHDRANAGGPGYYSYSYGYQDPANNWRTIMSYNCPGGCARIAHFSNPNVLYNTTPTGRPSTATDSADNARTFNNTASIVANFRQSIPDPPPLVTPVPDSMLMGSTVTFTGKHVAGDLQHWIYVGTTPGSFNIKSQNMGTSHTVTVSGLPQTGTIYVRYWTRFTTGWRYMDHTYLTVPGILSPVPGSLLWGSSATFTGEHTIADLQHWVYVGTTGVGSANLKNQNLGLGHSVTVNGLPNSGKIYVRYWTRTSTGWKWKDHTYTKIGFILPEGSTMKP